MTDEGTKPTEGTTEETTTEIPKSAVRNHPLFREVTAKQSEELAKIKEQYDALQRSIEEEKEAQRKAKMEEEGNYKQLIAEERAKREALEAQHNRTLVMMQLENKLSRKMRVDNETWFRGAVAGFSGDADAIDSYIAQLAESEANKIFFEGPPATGHPGTETAIPSAPGAKLSGSQLKAMKESDNPEHRKAALDYTMKYLETHGNLDGLYK